MGDQFGQASRAFRDVFSAGPEIAVWAPGRVNLIGGHLDYHEGFVLPLAIDRGLTLVGRRGNDRRVRVYSKALRTTAWLDLDRSQRHPTILGRYCQGAITALGGIYPLDYGCDVLINGDLPAGAGLSSSSALVVGFAELLAEANGLSPPPLALAKIGSEAEHWFGTTGGIMDQYVIAQARSGHALLIDCRALTHRAIRIPDSAAVVIAHTGTAHQQIVSPFADRRREAEAGLHLLQTISPGMVRALRDVPYEMLAQHRNRFLEADPSGAIWRRCHHVVTEMGRVHATASALEDGDLGKAGALIQESHTSLRDDYEVSSIELNTMIDAASDLTGWFGGRMTGGGFGGCTVNLVAAPCANTFCSQLTERYENATGIHPLIFQTGACAGLTSSRIGG